MPMTMKKDKQFRDPDKLFDEAGKCKICGCEIYIPLLVNHDLNTFKMYRHKIEYHFELHALKGIKHDA